MLNLIQRITQLLILFLLTLGSLSIITPLNYIVLGIMLIMFLWSELGESTNFFDEKIYWKLSFKLFKYPKRVINADDGKSYWVDVLDEPGDRDSSFKWIIVYERFFPFWVAKHKYECWLHEYDINQKVNNAINEYIEETNETKRHEGLKSQFRNWEGIVGSKDSIKAYKRNSKIDNVVK